jgi:hypothetical protein
MLYSGTPALKTDFTRTGKRSYKGAINDFCNSTQRYYINNFCDGYNQDCLDLAGCILEPKSEIKRSFLPKLSQLFILLLIILKIASVLINVLYPNVEMGLASATEGIVFLSDLFYPEYFWKAVIWSGVFMVTKKLIKDNGRRFVDLQTLS